MLLCRGLSPVSVTVLLLVFVGWELSGGFVEGRSFEEDVTISLEQKKAIDKLRNRVLPYITEEWMKDDIYLVKWLRVSEFDVSLAERWLIENIKWRKEDNIGNIAKEDFSDVSEDYPYSSHGFDREGRPLFIVYVGEWDLRKAVATGRVRRIYRYLHKELEHLSGMIRDFQQEGKNVTQAVLLLDMTNFNLIQHACIRCLFVIVEALTLYETHYPGLADKIILANTPPSVNTVVELAKQAMSKEMRSSLKVYGSNKAELEQALQKYIEPKYLPVELGGTATRGE